MAPNLGVVDCSIRRMAMSTMWRESMSSQLTIRLETKTGGLVIQQTIETPLQRVSPQQAHWVVPLMTAPEVLVWGCRTFLLVDGSADEVGDLVYREVFAMMIPDFEEPLAESPGAPANFEVSKPVDIHMDPECIHAYCSQPEVCKIHGCQSKMQAD